MKSPLWEKLAAGRVVLGLCNMYPAAGIVEMMCPGWDFVWIDGQHGQHQYDSALAAVRAADLLGIASVLRSPGHEPGIMGPLCDLSPTMLMVPMVDTADQARAIVNATRFWPLGNRSYGGRRPIDLYGRDYHQAHEVGLVAQIETLEAVENAGEIAAVPGVDVLFCGLGDLKLRLELPINAPSDTKALQEVMLRTAEAAQQAGKVCACTVGSTGEFSAALAMGYRMIAAGSDVLFIRTQAPARLAELRRIAEAAVTP